MKTFGRESRFHRGLVESAQVPRRLREGSTKQPWSHRGQMMTGLDAMVMIDPFFDG